MWTPLLLPLLREPCSLGLLRALAGPIRDANRPVTSEARLMGKAEQREDHVIDKLILQTYANMYRRLETVYLLPK
ncbi:hypothetical protein F2P81_009962 [Scophthalmus maximus]|uniref:Uncharacterized protein n=1 Tax=Scophthalmus maximus TaxID=52904 RepID=A0A6A4SYA0_SCOMX|nr:hypothetical protein F2P81_009962 [Scophthalmus maximus]